MEDPNIIILENGSDYVVDLSECEEQQSGTLNIVNGCKGCGRELTDKYGTVADGINDYLCTLCCVDPDDVLTVTNEVPTNILQYREPAKKRGRPRKKPVGENAETTGNNYFKIERSAASELRTYKRKRFQPTIIIRNAESSGQRDDNDEHNCAEIRQESEESDEILGNYVDDDGTSQSAVNFEIVSQNNLHDGLPKNVQMCCESLEKSAVTTELPAKIFECQQPIRRRGRPRKYPVNGYNGTTVDNNETIADNNETIADYNETIVNNDETIADNNETIADNNETIADNNETIVCNYLKKKRGRPRIHPIKEHNETIVNNSLRKRGRPRKYPINEKDKTIACNVLKKRGFLKNYPINKNNKTIARNSFKTRGRQRKYSMIEYNNYFETKDYERAASEPKDYERKCFQEINEIEGAESKERLNDQNYAKKPVDGIYKNGVLSDELLANSVYDDETLQATVNCELVLNGVHDRSRENIMMVIPRSITNENNVNGQKLAFERNLISRAHVTHETERLCTSKLESTPSAKFKCPQCPFELATDCQLRRHETLHELLPAQCRDCWISFISKSELALHTCKAKAGNDRTTAMYKCANCPREFATYWWLKRHIKTNHQKHRFDSTQGENSIHGMVVRESDFDAEDATVATISDHITSQSRASKCRMCPRTFKFKRTLFWHMSHKHKIKQARSFSCNKCLRKFPFRGWLEQHEKTAHLTKLTDADYNDLSRFVCKQCPRRFRFKSQLKLHTHKRNNRNNSATHRIERCETEEPNPIEISEEFNNKTGKSGTNSLNTADHIRGNINKEKRAALSTTSKVQDIHSDIVEASVETANRIDAIHQTKRTDDAARTINALIDCTSPYKCANCPCEFGTSWGLNRHVLAAHQDFAADPQTRLENSTRSTESRSSDYDVDESHESDNESKISDISFESKTTIKSGKRDSNTVIKFGEREVKTRLQSQLKQPVQRRSKQSIGEETSEVQDSDSELVQSPIETTDHIDAFPFKCKECPRAFRFRSQLNTHRHKTRKPSEGVVTYEVQDSDSEVVKSTIETTDHIDAFPFKCQECPRAFRFQSQLNNHGHKRSKPSDGVVTYKVQDSDSEVVKSTIDTTDPIDAFPFKCQECPRAFRFQSQLNNHGHKKRKPSDGVVTYKVQDSDSEVVKSTIETTDSIDAFPFKCQECPRAFRFQSQLNNHGHKKRKPSDGVVTYKVQDSDSEVVKSTIETTDRIDAFPFKCQECPRAFRFQSQLNNHGHKKRKPSDGVVTYKVQDSDSEVVKSTIETTDRIDAFPFKCQECPCAFRFQSQLNNHGHKKRKPSDGVVTYKVQDSDSEVVKSTIETTDRIDAFPFKCQECPRAFRFQSQLKQHVHKTYKSSDDRKHPRALDLNLDVKKRNIKCPKCPRTFKWERTLIWHLFMIHNIKCVRGFSCDKCPCKFSNSTLLKQHENTAHPTKPTDADSDVEVSMSKTTDLNPNKAMFRCILCPREFANSHLLKRHRNAAHQPALKIAPVKHCENTVKLKQSDCSSAYKCPLCQQKFATYPLLERHKETSHKDESEEYVESHSNGEKPVPHQSSVGDELPWRCALCPCKFASFMLLQQHVNASHHSPERETPQENLDETYKCNYCPCTFQINQHLLLHLSRVHKTEEKGRLVGKEDVKPTLKCLKCPRTFKFGRSLAHHAKIHNHNKTVKLKTSDCSALYKCTQCHQKFAKYWMLESHKETEHKGDKQDSEESDESNDANQKQDTDSLNKCEKSPLVVKSNANLAHQASVMHKSINADRIKGGTFKCRKCHLEFAIKKIYMQHLHKFHKSEWSNITYVCDICARMFEDRKGLQMHISAAHSNVEKPATQQSEVRDNLPLIQRHESASYHSPKRKTPQENRFVIYKCKYCPHAYRNNQHLLWHVSRVHKTNEKGHSALYKCTQCRQKFATYWMLERHEETRHKGDKQDSEESDESNDANQKLDTESLNKCEKPPLDVQSNANLAHEASMMHTSINADRIEGGTFKCRKCHLEFATKKIYMQHLHKFHKSEWSNITYMCDICARMFKDRKGLQMHISAVHSNVEKPATQQSEVRDNLPLIQRHDNASYHSPKRETPQENRSAIYKCKYCPRAFRINLHLYRHVSRVHKTEAKERLVGKVKLQPNLKCLKCPRMFKFERTLAWHHAEIHNIHNEKQDLTLYIKCEKCPRKFKYASQVTDHFNRAHKIKQSTLFKCPKCPCKFKFYTGLKNHEKNVHQTNDQTDANASSDSDVILSQVAVTQKAEQKENDAKFPFNCANCPRVFQSKANLHRHTFTIHGSMNSVAHRNKEKSVDPFECQKCKRSFASKNRLLWHLSTTHKTYKCEFCNCDFILEIYLKEHLRINHAIDSEPSFGAGKLAIVTSPPVISISPQSPKKTFKCSHCTSSFNSQSGLQNHFVTVHVKAKKYLCNMCSVGFSRLEFMTAHILDQHSDISISSIPIIQLSCTSCKINLDIYQTTFPGVERRPHEYTCTKCTSNEDVPPAFMEIGKANDR